MISDKLDIDIITRSNNVKKVSRGELEKQEEYNYDTEYQMNLSKYKLATGDDKNIHKSAILSNLESRSLYLNDSDLTKQQERQGLLDFMKIIDRLHGFEHIEFHANDIVRSCLVKEYIIAREELGLCA